MASSAPRIPACPAAPTARLRLTRAAAVSAPHSARGQTCVPTRRSEAQNSSATSKGDLKKLRRQIKASAAWISVSCPTASFRAVSQRKAGPPLASIFQENSRPCAASAMYKGHPFGWQCRPRQPDFMINGRDLGQLTEQPGIAGDNGLERKFFLDPPPGRARQGRHGPRGAMSRNSSSLCASAAGSALGTSAAGVADQWRGVAHIGAHARNAARPSLRRWCWESLRSTTSRPRYRSPPSVRVYRAVRRAGSGASAVPRGRR